MKAKFEVTQTIQPWGPPFDKKVETKNYAVTENEKFDAMPKTNSPVFTLLRIGTDKALIKYHLEFTLKGYVQPQNKEIWIEKDESKELSFLWGDDGLTKKITYIGVEAGTGEPSIESKPSRSNEDRRLTEHTEIIPAQKRPVF
ncbi:MAG: hypothetical protein J4215_01465 [Candidatus Diapherotrites archaeon]|uniref:Uncharacterized protein n=1 Tax=Candidatus Iainarchaeum sp. TaxID=3101447 RepID=A0A8T4L1U3_9ARCH|nr:hypothetical protein [Candidatus Diapherotrites archaeon]